MPRTRPVRAAAALALALLAGPARPAPVVPVPVDVTGFMDVLWTADDLAPGDPDFQFGQVELDFAACLSPHTCACLALARCPGTDAFTLGSATVEYLIAGRGTDCRHHYEKWDRSGIAVGRFDVPFGVDWRVYPSVDRRTISAPDVVGFMHCGWNEVGAMAFIEAPRYTARAWLTNGLAAELALPDAAPVPLATESALGARASVLPCPGVEVGFSGSTFDAVTDGQSMAIWGADLTGAAGPWALTAEYIRHDLHFGPGTGGEVFHRGWYAQGVRDLDGWYLFARYDLVTADTAGQADLRTFTGGLGLAVAAPAELRFEYRGALDDGRDDSWQTQLVAGF